MGRLLGVGSAHPSVHTPCMQHAGSISRSPTMAVFVNGCAACCSFCHPGLSEGGCSFHWGLLLLFLILFAFFFPYEPWSCLEVSSLWWERIEMLCLAVWVNHTSCMPTSMRAVCRHRSHPVQPSASGLRGKPLHPLPECSAATWRGDLALVWVELALGMFLQALWCLVTCITCLQLLEFCGHCILCIWLCDDMVLCIYTCLCTWLSDEFAYLHAFRRTGTLKPSLLGTGLGRNVYS